MPPFPASRAGIARPDSRRRVAIPPIRVALPNVTAIRTYKSAHPEIRNQNETF
jgi:hypothetical protein